MKKLIFTILSSLTITAQANNCIDIRAAEFGPCSSDQERIYLKGQCARAYEIEDSFCSNKTSAPNCVEVRAADFRPCVKGQTRIFVQGKCLKNYEVEHSYCANR